MYLAHTTRGDILMPTVRLAQQVGNPTEGLYNQLAITCHAPPFRQVSLALAVKALGGQPKRSAGSQGSSQGARPRLSGSSARGLLRDGLAAAASLAPVQPSVLNEGDRVRVLWGPGEMHDAMVTDRRTELRKGPRKNRPTRIRTRCL